jgi:hypothetical protein
VSPAAGVGATQQQQQQQRPAVSTAGLTEADGWHSHAPSKQAGWAAGAGEKGQQEEGVGR